jgi:hypothetical protein
MPRCTRDVIVPVGKASSMCTAPARDIEPSQRPIVKSRGSSAADSAGKKNDIPTATMSGPMRLCGRRDHA